MTVQYLTRTQVAELYPISVHTLAKLAAQGKGPRFYKPTDKCLYRAEDIEAWIEAAAVIPAPPAPEATPLSQSHVPTRGGRGRALPKPKTVSGEPSNRSGRKSLPPSPNSWLLRDRD